MIKIILPFILSIFIAHADNIDDFMNRQQEVGSLLYKQYFGDLIDEDIYDNLLDYKEDIPTLLIFSSRSVPKATMKNYVADVNTLQLNHFIIYRGLGSETMNSFKKLASKEKTFFAKVHPILFKELNITKVPTLVYALCPKEFRYKQCKYLYRVDGDVSIEYFMQKIYDKNKDEKIKKYLQKLNSTLSYKANNND